MKLGRLAPTARSRMASVPLHDFLTAPLPPAPPSFDGITGAKIQMFGNDQYGNCTFAGLANFDAIRAQIEKRDPACTESAVVSAYLAYNHGQDVGAVEIDVLQQAQANGFQLGPGEPWMLANGSVTIPVTDIASRKSLIALIGAVYLGIALPNTAQGQPVWDVTDQTLRGNAAPGSWGLHCLLDAYYDANGVRKYVTWGEGQEFTNAFDQSYVDEVHVPFDALGVISQYVDVPKILAALQAAMTL